MTRRTKPRFVRRHWKKSKHGFDLRRHRPLFQSPKNAVQHQSDRHQPNESGHLELIDARCIRGNTGFAASDFVKSVEADLLVIPVHKSETSGERLPNHLAWIADVIPCNLWLIR